MGRLKKGHNWKARQNNETKIDRSSERKIVLDLPEGHNEYGQVDSENILVLPSQKRRTTTKFTDVPRVKPLSRKHRKKLEKVIERKEKKLMRIDLLAKLQDVQATKEEISKFTSITEVHSGKPKRKFEDVQSEVGKVNAISGSKKKPRDLPMDEPDSSSTSEEDESSEEEGDEKFTSDVETHIGPEQAVDAVDETKNTNTEGLNSKPQEAKPVHKPLKPEKKLPVKHIHVNRKADVQEQRLKLPILAEEQVVMEAINDNPIIILCGETGSGKTTQVPQFLYEAGYAHDGGIIGVTEPRRVAAISMSHRVAHEMNLSRREVSYQIRYEGNVSPDTKIKFMTDGVLMKEIQKDFLLTKYKVIIIDEAHERSVYTDIVIGLLSRIVPLRNKRGKPLKLIIMSATLRVEDFTENTHLFKLKPPVVKVESRQFPVTIHFNRRTQEDYLSEAYRKICKIHRKLPGGGILVFVTGQQEVHTLCAKLRNTFPSVKETKGNKQTTSEEVLKKNELPDIKLEDYSALPLDEQAELEVPDNDTDGLVMSHDTGGQSDDELLEDDALDEVAVSRLNEQEEPLLVLPMYSLLSSDKQAKVFEDPPEGSRLCVVATNVAETSLTIPNIRYVIDTGKVKTKFYDKVTGVSAFRVTWTSQASANQRAGRAGRTGPGHCYRLYSSAVFNDELVQFSPPEICRRPVDDLVLQMKDMLIEKVINFPFPTPPDITALKAAEDLLVALGALERTKPAKTTKGVKVDDATKITALGRTMAHFPVSPRYGKMLSLGHQHNLLPYVVAMVAALSVQEIFVTCYNSADSEKEEHQEKNTKMRKLQRTWAGAGNSLSLGDLMVMLKAVGAWEFSGGTQHFCEQHGLRYKAMIEIRKLRGQLTNTVNSVIPGADLIIDPQMAPPSDLQAMLLRQILLSGLCDHIARRLPDPPQGTDPEKARSLRNGYQGLLLEEPLFIHPNSVLYKSKAEYIMYQNIDETSKMYMKGVSIVEAEWLPLFVANQCRFSKPADDPPPSYHAETGRVLCHMSSTFGPHFWPMSLVELEYPESLERYKWFARFFLEGQVCPILAKYTKVLLTAPVTMIKSWANLQPRTQDLMNVLMSKKVYNHQKLKEVWKTNPKYLLITYKDWIPEVLHDEVTNLWPPV